MTKPKFLFGDIVVVDEYNIGVVVKSWLGNYRTENNYDVYVRMYNGIKNYNESEVDRYRVRHKYLDEQEIGWQNSQNLKRFKAFYFKR